MHLFWWLFFIGDSRKLQSLSHFVYYFFSQAQFQLVYSDSIMRVFHKNIYPQWLCFLKMRNFSKNKKGVLKVPLSLYHHSYNKNNIWSKFHSFSLQRLEKCQESFLEVFLTFFEILQHCVKEFEITFPCRRNNSKKSCDESVTGIFFLLLTFTCICT